MGRVSQWAVRRPWYALLTWVGMMVVLGFLGARFGGDYNDNFELPDTESTTAQDLLADLSGGGAGTGAGLEGQVVWRPASGQATDDAPKAAMTRPAHRAVDVAGRVVRDHPLRRAAGLGLPGAAACPGRRG